MRCVAAIRAEGSAGRQRTRIEVQGRAPLKPALDWLAVSQPLPLRGELPYQLQLNIEGADSLLTLDSDLKGLAIDLPPPFGKAATDDRRTTRWRMTLAGAQRRYQLEQPEQLSLVLQMPPGEWAKSAAALVIGPGKAVLPAQAGLRVRGELAEVSLEDWQAALKPYAQADVRPSVAADVALQIGRFRGFRYRPATGGRDPCSALPLPGNWESTAHWPRGRSAWRMLQASRCR